MSPPTGPSPKPSNVRSPQVGLAPLPPQAGELPDTDWTEEDLPDSYGVSETVPYLLAAPDSTEAMAPADPELVAQVEASRSQAGQGSLRWAGPIGVAAETGVRRLQTPPRGAPPVHMADRHVLDKLNFFKGVKSGAGAGNSYLLQPLAKGELGKLYGEAFNTMSGKAGTVKLANGQTWSLNKTTGKFFPVSGPGIVKLSQQEVSFMRMMAKQIKSGKVTPQQALENVSRAMAGQKYQVTPQLQQAMTAVAEKLGYSSDELGRALAPHLPKSANAKVPPEAQAAAKAKAGGKPFRFVKWGGRTLLVVGLAVDAYEVYNAENRPKALTKKAGAWGASIGAGSAAANAASPLLAGGPWGWAAYGGIVLGASVGGYFVGGEAAETAYEWTFE